MLLLFSSEEEIKGESFPLLTAITGKATPVSFCGQVTTRNVIQRQLQQNSYVYVYFVYLSAY